MSSRPDIHVQASFLTFHCDIFLFGIFSSLFSSSHIITCDIHYLSFLSSLLTRHYPCFTLSGGFSRVTAWRIVTFFPSFHPMGSGSEILFWEVVLSVRIHVASVHGESLFIWLCISWEISHYWSEYAQKKIKIKNKMNEMIAHYSFYYSPLGMCMDVLVRFIEFMC